MTTPERIAKRLNIPVLLLLVLCTAAAGQTQPGRVLPFQEYLDLAARNDTEFEEILIDELTLQYEDDLRLPARDLVLSVKEEALAFLDDSRGEAATQVSLSRLFPFTGTKLEAGYDVRPATDEDAEAPASISLSIAQSIARNAFGRSTRLLDRIIGLEVEVARHQIEEAYEDYLASIMVAYYEWWAAYENLAIGESSYRENVRLLDNILDRQKQQVALPIDVNKTRLQVLAKKENLVSLAEAYSNSLHVVERVIRKRNGERLLPEDSPALAVPQEPFEEVFAEIRIQSRTFSMLRMLEQKSELNVDRQADDILPSIDLLFGVEVDGNGHGLQEGEGIVSLGVALEWPIPAQVARAGREVARINVQRARLSTLNTRYRLYTQLKNLYLQISRERQLTAIADEKIGLAQEVLEAETENYSFGKVSLNDYIDAVNVLDNNRFSRLRHSVQQKVLTAEWMRLADRLIASAEDME